MTRTIIILAIFAAIVAMMAIFTAHQNQSYQIQELSRQFSEVLDKVVNIETDNDCSLRVVDDMAPPSSRDLISEQRNCVTCTLPTAFTYASDFGTIGDSKANDGPALQAAIDSAASRDHTGGTVILPAGTFFTNVPLVIPGGVTLQGMGYGSSPLAIKFDAGGSTIAYCGEDHAVKITGSSSGLRDLAVYDWPYNHGDYDGGCPDIQAAGGVLVEADGKLVESVFMSNVFIYFFLGGPALSLVAMNKGGIGYGNYQNLRMRHAQTGVLLEAKEDFVK